MLGTRGATAAKLTAGGAALVLVAGISIVALDAPGSHAAPVPSAQPSDTSSPDQAAGVFQVVSITPTPGAHGVNGASPIWVQFSAPLSASTPLPQISPKIAGNWTVQGDLAVFVPAGGFFEDTKVTVTVPSGVTSADGTGTLSSPVTDSFTTGSFSTMRLQQLLAQLGYLPLTWTSKSRTIISPGNAQAQMAAAYSPPARTFSWQGDYPVEPEGPVEGRRGQHPRCRRGQGPRVGERPDHGRHRRPSVWSDLLAAVAKGKDNPHGYTYALANQNLPETLTVWHDGRVVLKTLVNTGISGRSTVDGTYPVYLRYYFTYMKGTNPDGTPYDDPVYYVSYFNGGDAVHFPARRFQVRPRDLGCVELPWRRPPTTRTSPTAASSPSSAE